MPLDFSGQSLVGRSFKGQDLANADFSQSDIRSANFANANLRGATFHQSRAGVSRPRQLLQCSLLIACSVALGMVSIIVGTFSATFWLPENVDQFGFIPGLLCLLSLAAMGFPLIYQGFTRSGFQNTMVVCAIVIAGIGAGTLTEGAAQAAYSAGSIASAVVLAMSNVVILTSAGLIGGRWLVGLGLACSIASSLKHYGYIYWPAIETVSGQSTRVMADYPLNHVGMVIVVLEIAIAGVYVASRVLAKDERFDLVKKVASNLVTLGGTTFHRANLTNANFTEATLKCTDLSKAILVRTNFHHAQQLYTCKLSYAHFEDSYLQLPRLQQLAATQIGKNQNFDQLDLKGIYLRSVDLSDTSFINTNLSAANLQNVNLSRAKLINTQLDDADLLGACLTGAYIHNITITADTQLGGIECQYIFTRLPTAENPNPNRIPSAPREVFKPGEFASFIRRSYLASS
ncbi:MAG: pentapeptide repeat-containing protein [Cyanobacteria bacterium P01_C01_bin.121]